MSYVLGLDQGTSGIKAVLMDPEGNTVATATSRYPLIKKQPGWVEQDPMAWWGALRASVQEVTKKVDKYMIKGLAISGQINGVVFLDEQNELLTNAIIWLDQRAEAESQWANEVAGDLLKDATFRSMSSVTALSKVVWIKKNQKEIYDKTKAVLTPLDWLNYKLTGLLRSEATGASLTGAFDLEQRRWSDEVLDKLEIKKEIFQELTSSYEKIGELPQEIAEDLGLHTGVAVFGGAGDIPCLLLGSGCIEPGTVCVGIGTAGHVVTATKDLKTLPPDQLWPMCHVVPDMYGLLGCSFTGGVTMSWFTENFKISYDELLEEAEAVGKNTDQLFFMPWLQGTSVPTLDVAVKGGFVGLGLHHTRGHMIRAMIEGIIFDLRHSLECFKQQGIAINEIRIGEGWAQSPLWLNIQSAVFGQDLKVLKTKELSAVGSSLIASVGVGNFPNFEAACAAGVKISETVTCNQEDIDFYEERYRKYCSLYPTMKQWYHQEAA